MNALKGLYIWTLTTLLILAGCLGGGVIDEGEGQDANNNTGMKPIIYKHADIWCTVGDDGDNDSDRGIDITCDASQIAVDHPDGTVAQFGLDFDKDKSIDARFDNSFDIPLNYEEIEKLDGDFPLENLTWYNNGKQYPENKCITSIYLIAEDLDYQSTIELMFLELSGYQLTGAAHDLC